MQTPLSKTLTLVLWNPLFDVFGSHRNRVMI